MMMKKKIDQSKVISLIQSQSEIIPNQICLIADNGILTYKQLIEKINYLVEKITALQLTQGEPIGIALPNSAAFIICLLALERLGHPCILLGFGFKPREFEYHIKNSGIKYILSIDNLNSVMIESGAILSKKLIDNIICWCFSHDYSLPDYLPGDFICQLTSGTNGLSKAAIRTNLALISEIKAVGKTLKLMDTDTVLTIPPIYHAYGLMAALSALCFGARLILMNGFVPAKVAYYLNQENVTIMFAVPFMYNLLCQAIDHENILCSQLRYCISAGAPLNANTDRDFTSIFGLKISQIYGSTETGVITLQTDHDSYNGSVGFPIEGRQIAVFDEKNEVLKAGQIGEFRTKSMADARAYLYPAENNYKAFQDGWFCMGDYGHIDETGCVFIKGRKSNIINVAGMKVDPVEVENEIVKISGVTEVVVTGVDGVGNSQMVKAIVVANDKKVTKKMIIDHCVKQLSSFKVPRIIDFIDQLPKSQTGKILKKYLDDMN